MNVHTNLDLTDRRVKSEFVCKEFDWLWCKRGKIFGFVFKSLFFVKKNTKTRDLDALEVIIFVKWKNQAILIQNILILRIICIKYVIITSFTPK